MKTLRYLIIALALCSPALAWNCTGNDIRVQVPPGTQGTGTGDAPGNVVTVQGITFECEPPTPVTPTAPVVPPITNTNINNANSASNSASNSNSSSNSTSSSNQNQTQKQRQTQTQTATGGNANSSSNATGGNAIGNGDNANNTTVNEAKIPVASAYAPTAFPSAPCVKSYGGGAQTMAFGASFGAGKIDPGCDERETARAFALLGSKLAACKVMIQGKEAKKAGITLEDCLGPKLVPVQVISAVPVQVAPAQIIVPAPSVTIINQLPSAPVLPPAVVRAVVKKRVQHLPPQCQNELVRVCK